MTHSLNVVEASTVSYIFIYHFKICILKIRVDTTITIKKRKKMISSFIFRAKEKKTFAI